MLDDVEAKSKQHPKEEKVRRELFTMVENLLRATQYHEYKAALEISERVMSSDDALKTPEALVYTFRLNMRQRYHVSKNDAARCDPSIQAIHERMAYMWPLKEDGSFDVTFRNPLGHIKNDELRKHCYGERTVGFNDNEDAGIWATHSAAQAIVHFLLKGRE